MDIKVSRFDKGPANQRIDQRMALFKSSSQMAEELIPNEEPLIQIRQFNGAGGAGATQQ
jgi:hypothetical protein